MLIICAFCGQQADKASGSVNRSIAKGAPLYCSKYCSGLARRKHKTAEQKVAEKAEYDRKRRSELRDKLREEKRQARLKLLAENPSLVRAREKASRKKRKQAHLEYCRTPEYRAWKTQYDQRHRARKNYGDFAEAFLTLLEVEAEVSARASRQEVYAQNGTLNKTQERKRDYARKTGHAQRS